MTFPFTTTRRIEFRDTDAAGIMHFSTYFTYMEEAEHEALRSIGLSVYMEHEGRTISWPRVSAHCDYQRAVRFEDELTLSVGLEKIGEKSLTYQFAFTNREQLSATGRIVAVCCIIDHDLPPKSIAIPPDLRERLAVLEIAE